MRSGSLARAKNPAPPMGRPAAEGIRRAEHRRIRASLPDRRAAAADAGVYRPEAGAGKRRRHAPQTGRRKAPPDDRLRRGIQYAETFVGIETTAFTGSCTGLTPACPLHDKIIPSLPL